MQQARIITICTFPNGTNISGQQMVFANYANKKEVIQDLDTVADLLEVKEYKPTIIPNEPPRTKESIYKEIDKLLDQLRGLGV